MTLRSIRWLLFLLVLLGQLSVTAQEKSTYYQPVLLHSRKIFRPNADTTQGIIARIFKTGGVTMSMYAYDPYQEHNCGPLLYQVTSEVTSEKYAGVPIRILNKDLGVLKDYIHGDWMSNDLAASLLGLSGYHATTRNEVPYPVGELPYPVVVELKLSPGAQLGNVKFPGMEPMDLRFFEAKDHFESVMAAFKNPLDYPDYYVVAAHRGYWKDYPENSYPAFDLTWGSGVDMVELDTRLTRDDTLVAFHDACLDRVTTGKGKLRDLTWAELQKLKLRDRFARPTGFHVVSIREALTYLRGRALINLDIKEFKNDKSSGAEVNLWASTFVAALKIAKQTGTLSQLVIKGKETWDDLQDLLLKAGVSLNEFTYTPVAFGWGPKGYDLDAYVRDWLFQAVPAIELTYKVAYDPLLKYIPRTINRNIRTGIYTFWPEDPDGVIAEDNINDSANYCAFNYRQYAFLDEDLEGASPRYTGVSGGSSGPSVDDDSGPSSGSKGKKMSAPDMLDDGRGDWDWLFSKGANFVITDRPVLMVEYLKQMGRRSFEKPVMREVTLPECAMLENGSGGTKPFLGLRGMVRKVADYNSLEFFSADTRRVNIDTNLVLADFKQYSNGKTRQWVVDHMKKNNGNCTCGDLFADSPAVAAIRRFPLHSLPEWSILYPDYDLYINANWFDVRQPWPVNDPGARASLPKAMYKEPCTNVFGYWQGAEHTGKPGTLLTKNSPEEAFDALLMTKKGMLKMVKSGDVPSYFEGDPDHFLAKWALGGYIIAKDGTPVPYNDLPKGTNKTVQKKRSLVGLNGNEIVFAAFQSPMMEPYQAASLMVKYFNCKDVFIFDAGGSTTMLTSKGVVPAVEAPAGPYIRAGSAPEDKNLDDDRVYRPIPNFLAVRVKQ